MRSSVYSNELMKLLSSWTWSSPLSKISSRSFRSILNKLGLILSPCRTPILGLKAHVNLSCMRTYNILSWYICWIMFRKGPFISSFANLYNKAECKTESNAFWKSTKQTYNFDLLFVYFSINVRKMNIWYLKTTVRCQIKVHKVNFKAKNNAYFQHLLYFKSKRQDLHHKLLLCLDTSLSSLSLHMFRKFYSVL